MVEMMEAVGGRAADAAFSARRTRPLRVEAGGRLVKC